MRLGLVLGGVQQGYTDFEDEQRKEADAAFTKDQRDRQVKFQNDPAGKGLDQKIGKGVYAAGGDHLEVEDYNKLDSGTNNATAKPVDAPVTPTLVATASMPTTLPAASGALPLPY